MHQSVTHQHPSVYTALAAHLCNKGCVHGRIPLLSPLVQQGLCSMCAAGSARMVPQACGAPGAHSHGTTCAPPVQQACAARAGTPCNQGCTGLVQQGLHKALRGHIWPPLFNVSLRIGLWTTPQIRGGPEAQTTHLFNVSLRIGPIWVIFDPPGIGAKYDPNMTQNGSICLMYLLGLDPWGPSPGGQI